MNQHEGTEARRHEAEKNVIGTLASAPCLRAFVPLCLLLFLLASCNETPKVSDVDVKQLIYKQLQTMRQEKKHSPVVIVDVRKPEKYAAEHIEGAVNIPLPEIVEGHPKLAEARTIVVYSSGWTEYLSTAAAKRLMALGYSRVYDFRGGLELWKQEGGRTESDAPATQPAAP